MRSRLLTSLTGATLTGIAIICCLTLSVQAQTEAKAAGEISAARAASVNGVSVRSSGMTVFSNSRIRTAEKGIATVSLGKRGRVELGAKTDLTLQFTKGSVGGDLHSGKLVLSVPAGIAIALKSSKGLIKSDGLQPTILTIESDGEKAKILAHLGQASIIAGNKTELVTPGEEVAIGSSSGGEGWQRKRLVAASLVGAGGLAGVTQTAGQVAKPVAVAAKSPVSFTSLLNTGINFSLAQIIGNGRDPERYFNISVTCREFDSIFCRPRSPVTE